MPEGRSITSAIDFKGILGFVPGEDDKRWEELGKEAEERIARGGEIVPVAQQAAGKGDRPEEQERW